MKNNEAKSKSVTSYTSGDLLAGFIFGLVTAVPIGAAIYFSRIDGIREGVRIATFAAIGGGIVAIFGLLSLRAVLKRVFGHETPSAQMVFDDVNSAIRALEDGKTRKARVEASRAVSGGLGLYAWFTGRQWITSIFLGSIALFAGSASTWILFQQNSLIQRQSDILDDQKGLLGAQSNFMRDAMLSQDALRYVPLYGELNQTLSEIQAAGNNREGLQDYGLVKLSPDLSSRIVSLSRTFRPYWYFDSFAQFERASIIDPVGTNSSPQKHLPPMVFLSPERGMLLKAIVENNVMLTNPERADFSYADMRGSNVESILHGYGTVDETDNSLASCQRANGNFSLATIDQEFDQERVDLKGVLFKWPLNRFKLDNADYSFSILNGANIQDFEGSIKFESATLTNVKILTRNSVNLSGAIIRSVAFDSDYDLVPTRFEAQRAVFYRELCAPIPYQDSSIFNPVFPEDSEIYSALDSTLIMTPEGFSGAIFIESLKDRSLFPGIAIGSTGGRYLNDPDPRVSSVSCFYLAAVPQQRPPDSNTWIPAPSSC